jgi:membrane protease YdiL (CAAX protease family)
VRPDADVALREGERQWLTVAAWVYVPMTLGSVWWLASQEGLWATMGRVAGPHFLVDATVGGVGALLVIIGALACLKAGWTVAMETTLGVHLGPIRLPTCWALALCSGVGEEWLFRGVLQERWGPVAATLLFAAIHMPMERALILWPLFALGAGAMFSAMTLWTGTLTACMVAHVLINVVHMRRITLKGSAHSL